jgi:hypothetical protein
VPVDQQQLDKPCAVDEFPTDLGPADYVLIHLGMRKKKGKMKKKGKEKKKKKRKEKIKGGKKRKGKKKK